MNYLSEEEILNYLMTSDFNEGLTPDELIFLLCKFRNFYRISYGKNENMKVELEGKKREVEEFRTVKNKEVEKYLFEKIEAERKLERLEKVLKRKLTLNERFFGKIILQENEIK
jgi:NADH dehydrogenase/NADH:ubiquinone oxidoreductase subunit G